MPSNNKSLGGIRAFEHGGLWTHFNSEQFGNGRRIVGRAGAQPSYHGLAELAVGRETHAPGVLYRAETFLDNQTLLGDSQIDTPPDLLASESKVIPFGIK